MFSNKSELSQSVMIEKYLLLEHVSSAVGRYLPDQKSFAQIRSTNNSNLFEDHLKGK